MEAELRVGAAAARLPQTIDRSATVHRWAIIVSSAILVAVLANLLVHGYAYYRLPLNQRYRSSLHAELKPGGHTGRMLGLSGSLMMITLLGYSLRKRVRFMREWGKLSHWLHFHIFCGIAGPLLITFHTAFKLRGIVAISYWSMVVVAVSGVIGRYLYAQIPRAISGAEMEAKEINSEMDAVNERIHELLTPLQMRELQRITAFREVAPDSSLKTVLFMIQDDLRWLFIRRRLLRFAKGAPALTRSQRTALPSLVRERALCARRITFLKASRQLFKYWHIFHLPLAQTMYVTMIIHVTVAVMTGYFWRTS